MNVNYKQFNYNGDFIPTYSTFNTNIDYRNVGIGMNKPTNFLDFKGNCSITGNVFISGNLNYVYNNNLNLDLNHISLLKLDQNGLVIHNNLVSSNTSGVEWTIHNNNNILLTLKDINDNTKLDYSSDLVLTKNNLKINVTGLNNITLKYLFLIKNDQNLITDVLNSVIIKYNGIESNITKIKDGLYEFTNYIQLKYNQQHIIELVNLPQNSKVQLWGNYDYQAGSMWNKNSINNDLYINHNIGIFTNNPKTALHVSGNTLFNGNITVNKLITPKLYTNNLINNGILHTRKIEAYNNLLINSDKTPVSISTNKATDLFHIGDHFKVNDLQIDASKTIVNNITNSMSKFNIKKNDFFMTLNSTTSSVNINDVYFDNQSNINISNQLIINPLGNTITDSSDKYSLYVNGDMYLNSNLKVDSLKNSKNMYISRAFFTSYLNTNNIHTNLIDISSFCYIHNLYTNNIYIDNSFVCPQDYKETENAIFYDKQKDLFLYRLDNKTYTIYSNITSNTNNTDKQLRIDNIISTNPVYSVLLKSGNITVKKLEIMNQLSFDYNSEIYFNVNTLNMEILENSKINTFDLLY